MPSDGDDPSVPDSDARRTDDEAQAEPPLESSETEEDDSRQPRTSGCLITGIGASAGGLAAFQAFLRAMPRKSGIAFVLVPHLAPNHPSLLSEILARVTAMPVREAEKDTEVLPDHVYIIPPNKSLTIAQGRLRLAAPPLSSSPQTAIDDFLVSLAGDQGERGIGIILSGTGNHGAVGLRAIKNAGGLVMVQRPDTAEQDGMPNSAIATGLVDLILAPAEMPAALVRYAQHSYHQGIPDGMTPDALQEESLTRILRLLQLRARSDFRFYRKSMLLRRIQRRMSVTHLEQMADYLRLLEEKPEELTALSKDLLIGVTSFFRNPEAFQVLERQVIPALVESRSSHDPVRVWVIGCASGEEAYSIAMLLFERFATVNVSPALKVFATDIDESGLAVGRRGVYPSAILADVGPDRIRNFFVKLDDQHYQVNTRLRDAVVFATQNIIGDVSFPKMDLLCCRNLLIYLEPDVQEKVIALAHYTLNPDGYLFLGPSESLGPHTDLFRPISKKWRIYQRLAPTRRDLVEVPIVAGIERQLTRIESEAVSRPSHSVKELMRRQILEHFTPASVMVNRRLEVLSFLGPAVRFLEFPAGEPTRDLQSLARRGLRTRIRRLAAEAIRTNEPAIDNNARVERDGELVPCRITVRPVDEPGEASELLLIVFEERPDSATAATETAGRTDEPAGTLQLERELRTTREDLQNVIREQETSNEELRASNEEMTSINEELQSVNEELETSKEELQSVNEELSTVNSQLNAKVEELNELGDDLTNLLNSTEVATLFLTTDMRIRRFTPAATRYFRLQPSDFGRQLGDITRQLEDDTLDADCRVMVERRASVERQVVTRDGSTLVRRVLPFLASDGRVDGVVVTLSDITAQKRSADAIDDARQYAEAIVATVREALVVIDNQLNVQSANAAFYRMFRLTKEHVGGKPLIELNEGRWDVPRLLAMLREVVTNDSDIEHFEMELDLDEAGPRALLLNARQIRSGRGGAPLVLLAIEDVTQQKRAEELLARNEERVRLALDAANLVTCDLNLATDQITWSGDHISLLQRDPASFAELLSEVIHPADRDEFRRLVGAAVDEEGPIKKELRITRPDSTIRWVVYDGKVIQERSGRASRLVAVMVDTTDRRNLEDSLAEHARQLENVTQRLITIQEDERKSLARELHDQIGQLLAALKIFLDSTLKLSLDPEILRRLKEGVPLVAQAMQRVRHLSLDLRPSILDDMGLVPALRSLTTETAKNSGQKIVLKPVPVLGRLDPNLEIACFRIAQAALSNAVLHAFASVVTLSLRAETTELVLTVDDDGQGFDQESVMASNDGAIGIRSMIERARALNGRIAIRSSPGKGTTLEATFPLADRPGAIA
jgi:two-component system CheB/CheR fusion protein